MTKKKKRDAVELTHDERAHKMVKKERRACAKIAGRLFLSAKRTAAKIPGLEMSIINDLRGAGVQLNIASGREQLLFSLDGLEFTRKELLPYLPKGMGIDEIRACCRIANHIKKPVETADELKEAKAELQLAFQTFGLIDAPKPRDFQNPQSRNLFSDVVAKLAGLDVTMKEIEDEEPMEKWPTDKLDEFLKETKPIAARIAKAEGLLLGHAPKE